MTDRYAVFGNPLSQSKSPTIHARFAEVTGQDLVYGKVEARVDGFEAALRGFIAEGGKGCNVTAPFKLEAFALADHKTDTAALSGAANTLRFDENGITAENTDGIGLVTDIERNLGVSIAGKRVLMLGAGGAVRGSVLPFLKAGPAEFALLNRTATKAEAIRDALSSYGEIRVLAPEEAQGYDIVLNGTSSSLTGARPDVPDAAFEGCALAYDLSYGKGMTPFLTQARDAGATQLADGVGMLAEQAAVAFSFWRGGIHPDTAEVIEMLRVPLT